MIVLPILITLLIHFTWKGWENVLFELGSKRVDAILWRIAQFRDRDANRSNVIDDCGSGCSIINLIRNIGTLSKVESQIIWSGNRYDVFLLTVERLCGHRIATFTQRVSCFSSCSLTSMAFPRGSKVRGRKSVACTTSELNTGGDSTGA